MRLRGHEIVPFRPPGIEAGYRLYFEHMLADGGANCTPLIDGEPIDISIASNTVSWRMPLWLKSVVYRGIMRFLSPATAFGGLGSYKSKVES